VSIRGREDRALRTPLGRRPGAACVAVRRVFVVLMTAVALPAQQWKGDHGVSFIAIVCGVFTVCALTTVGSAAAVYGARQQSPIVGHVYVNANTPVENSIVAFDRHADGTLTPLAGSPFKAGGAGSGDSIGSQDALRVSPDGRFLLVVAAGSDEISVLAIAADGALSPVPGSPFASGGSMPVSIAAHEDLIYVANRGNGTDGANYTGFTLGDDGQLSALDGSTMPLSATAEVAAVFFNAPGTNLIGTQVGPDTGPFLIDSFAVGNGGKLAPAPGSPFTAQAAGPYAGTFSPTEPNQLFIANAHAGPNHGSVSAYTVASDGTLQPIAGSPYPNRQTAPCWMAITPDGSHLYVVNTANSSISRFEIHADGSLALLGNTILNDPTDLRAIDARVDPEGKFLYVLGADAGVVSILAIDGGDLTELPDSPVTLPAGTTPFGIAVT
jgi:6-phosphogluconolactonase